MVPAESASTDKRTVPALSAKLRGHYNYYGVVGNYASLEEFFYHVRRLHLKWLNRRSQRSSYTWVGYAQLLRYFALERPRIVSRAR